MRVLGHGYRGLMRPTETIEVCRKSHRRLLTALGPLTDGDFRVPSLLPGYTRGHVVTHVANKARAHAHVFGGPGLGEVRQVHPDRYDPDYAAEFGARRPAEELRSDLAQCFQLLEATWHGLDDTLWDRHGTMTAGRRTMAEIVWHHLRNVEVHHVDLQIGYRPSDWPPVLVEGELAKRLRSLPGRAEHAEILAWLLGRAPAPELSGPW